MQRCLAFLEDAGNGPEASPYVGRAQNRNGFHTGGNLCRAIACTAAEPAASRQKRQYPVAARRSGLPACSPVLTGSADHHIRGGSSAADHSGLTRYHPTSKAQAWKKKIKKSPPKKGNLFGKTKKIFPRLFFGAPFIILCPACPKGSMSCSLFPRPWIVGGIGVFLMSRL